MIDDNSRKIAGIYQYLLAKDVMLQQSCLDSRKVLDRKVIYAEDVYNYLIANLRYEIFDEFSRDIFNLLR